MKKSNTLSPSMTETQFDQGYWYADEIRAFAKAIGIPSASKYRKDELEELIRHFLRTGDIKNPARKVLSGSGDQDIKKGLSLKLPVIHYTNNKETKDFLEKEALKITPGLKRKSGARYRLNRWREEQINKGIPITYGDLVNQYVKLNQVKGSFPQVPSGRYINFLADYLTQEENPTRAQAIDAWKQLKKWDIPKTYQAWKAYKAG